MEIIPGVHRVPDVVCNVFVLAEADGLTLIDTGLPYSHTRVLRYLAALGYSPEAVKHILITHADRDHMGSVAALRAATGARVYASQLEGEAMALGIETRRLRLKPWHRAALMILRPLFVKARPAPADEFLQDGQVLPLFGGLQVVATPGHTPGHLSFYALERKVLFAGDSLRSHGGRLRASDGPNTADEALAVQSLHVQAALGARVICAGHGPVVMGAALSGI
jgi:glyoxylase-like metal-dependent hydrolase (beta-lactamase superfamily II)